MAVRHTYKEVVLLIAVVVVASCTNVVPGRVDGPDAQGDTGAADADPDPDGNPDNPDNVDAGNVDVALCGNGVFDDNEACDDQNTEGLDGCSASCQIEAGYECSTSSPSTCTTQALCPSATVIVPLVNGQTHSSCKSYHDSGYRASGQYIIDPDGAGNRSPFNVLCDMDTNGGGWTILVNNAPDATEPSGCRPRIGSVDSFTCGSPGCTSDWVAPAYGMQFTEMVWVAHTGDMQMGAHNLFTWASPTSIPNTQKWSLAPNQYNQKLSGFDSQSLIECRWFSSPGLMRVANENPRQNNGGYSTGDVITIFDQNLITSDPGKMSFTDGGTAGLDDFQDGYGCGDDWSPKASRGFASMIMIR